MKVLATAAAPKRLLIFIDTDGWAYHRRANALAKHCADGWQVTISSVNYLASSRPNEFDAVLLLDYAAIGLVRRAVQKPPLIVSFNADAWRRDELFKQVWGSADYTICVNRERYERARKHRVCYIPNGVDLDDFHIVAPIPQRPERILWCANERVAEIKGWPLAAESRPLLEAEGFECDFRLLHDSGDWLKTPCLATWYNSGGYFLCTSRTEGTANMVMEAAACGCVPVSTPVGNFNDWCTSTTGVPITDPSPDGVLAAMLVARRYRQLVANGAAGTIRAQWNWEQRAKYYFALCAALASGRTPAPFNYRDCQPEGLAK